MTYPTQWPRFFTATIHERKPILAPVKYKNIITDCLRKMVDRRQIELNAFVVMASQVHLIWQPLQHFTPAQVQASFTNLTAPEIIKQLSIGHPAISGDMCVTKDDRTFQVWKPGSPGIELFMEKTFMQKLDYIHYKPVRAGLVNSPEEYVYSSARFYYNGVDIFRMNTHCMGE